MDEQKKPIFEFAFLLIIFGVLLWMGIGAYYEHTLNYDYPKGFMATDAFYKYDRAAFLDETGDNRHTPSYLCSGVEGIEERYPFISFHNIVLFKDASGLELYNSQLLLSVLYTILGGLLTYIIIRKYNQKLALLSVGIYGFLFVGNFYIGFLFGWWPQIMGSLLLVGIIWVMLNFDLKGFHILLGLILASAFLTHTPEALFGGLFCAIAFGYNFIKNKFDLKLLKRMSLTFIVFLLFSLYYFPIFFESFLLHGSAGSITFSPKASSFPAPMFSHFGFYGWLILIGIGASIILLFNQKGKNWKYFSMAFFMGLVTYSALIGLNERVYQNRFFWPIYFGIFFALGIHTLIKLIPLKIPMSIYYIIPIILLVITTTYYFQPPSSSGLVANKEMWEGMQWVRHNVPVEETALVLYGDSYNQHGIYSAFGHVMYNVDWSYLPNNLGFDLSESVSKIESGTVTRNYSIRPFIHHIELPKRTSLLKLEYIDVWKLTGEDWDNGKGFRQRDLCTFNYVVIDRQSRVPQLAAYNLLIREKLLKNSYIKEVFSNNWYSILKNDKTGESCIL